MEGENNTFYFFNQIDSRDYFIVITENECILLLQDRHTGNWWLAFDTHLIVGYWPSSLVNNLRNGATKIQWGGEIVNLQDRSQHTSTQMGSGHFAEEGKQKASYFRNLEIIDERDITKQPLNPFSYASDPTCYNVISGIHSHSGLFFYYGGPGRNPNCN